MPAEARAQVEAERDAHDRRQGESRHERTGRAAPPLLGKDVADDRQGQSAQDSAERAGEHPRQNQRAVGRGQAAQKRAEQEAGVDSEEGRLATQSIDERRGDRPGQARGQRIRGDDEAELGRPDRQASASIAGPRA